MNGAERIAKERQRQIEEEGWTAEHDDQHRDGELANAAICYALSDDDRGTSAMFGQLSEPESLLGFFWPTNWIPIWWKPTPGNRIRELEKAGALIAAEIDRLLRLEKEGGQNDKSIAMDTREGYENLFQ
jgi:hypothetical protein